MFLLLLVVMWSRCIVAPRPSASDPILPYFEKLIGGSRDDMDAFQGGKRPNKPFQCSSVWFYGGTVIPFEVVMFQLHRSKRPLSLTTTSRYDSYKHRGTVFPSFHVDDTSFPLMMRTPMVETTYRYYRY